MDARLQNILQNFNRGRMSLVDMKWLIQEVRESKDNIAHLEEVAQIWIKRSLDDSKKLIGANERIRFLEEMITNGLGWEDMKNDI